LGGNNPPENREKKIIKIKKNNPENIKKTITLGQKWDSWPPGPTPFLSNFDCFSKFSGLFLVIFDFLGDFLGIVSRRPGLVGRLSVLGSKFHRRRFFPQNTKIGHETPFPGKFGADIWGIRVSIIGLRASRAPPGVPKQSFWPIFGKIRKIGKTGEFLCFGPGPLVGRGPVAPDMLFSTLSAIPTDGPRALRGHELHIFLFKILIFFLYIFFNFVLYFFSNSIF